MQPSLTRQPSKMQLQDQSSTKLHFYANRVLLAESRPDSSSIALALQFLDYPLLVLHPRREGLAATAADVLPILAAKSCVLKPEDAQEALQLVQRVRDM